MATDEYFAKQHNADTPNDAGNPSACNSRPTNWNYCLRHGTYYDLSWCPDCSRESVKLRFRTRPKHTQIAELL
ncbi:hypothetical protein BJV82DRAFT_673726 [Fennellomyces sp. T-0311]|nr:hypothetical protein BJV82DRAFT_673726 [Fennellomyces sp. T-0311]